MTNKQIFGTALKQPWALVVFGSNAPNGKRPATTVAYLTDDCGDHFLGGLVEWYRSRDEQRARYHYRYAKAKRIPKDDVLHVFPHTGRAPLRGPSEAAVRAAKRALPITEVAS